VDDPGRNLEHDIKPLAERAREEPGFAEELYAGLCNADWSHDDGATWHGSWRYAADVVAHLRGRSESYLDFYCGGGEGEIIERVAAAMAALGWRGIGHGAPLRMVDVATGESKVFIDGEWVDM
jgi:hypothetical protein